MKWTLAPLGYFLIVGLLWFFGGDTSVSLAQESGEKDCPAPMNNERLAQVLGRVQSNVQGQPGFWQLEVGGQPITVITDEGADRMRIIAPVARIEELSTEVLTRVMQANFDTALDARYAIARGVLWSVYLHPLSDLDDRQLLFGLGQAVNLAKTYGTTFSSGGMSFEGGDSGGLIRELLEQGESI